MSSKKTNEPIAVKVNGYEKEICTREELFDLILEQLGEPVEFFSIDSDNLNRSMILRRSGLEFVSIDELYESYRLDFYLSDGRGYAIRIEKNKDEVS